MLILLKIIDFFLKRTRRSYLSKYTQLQNGQVYPKHGYLYSSYRSFLDTLSSELSWAYSIWRIIFLITLLSGFIGLMSRLVTALRGLSLCVVIIVEFLRKILSMLVFMSRIVLRIFARTALDQQQILEV